MSNSGWKALDRWAASRGQGISEALETWLSEVCPEDSPEVAPTELHAKQGKRNEHCPTDDRPPPVSTTDNRGGLRATFEQVPLGLAHATPDGCLLQVNRKLCEIVGYSPEELLTRSFQDITHPDDLEANLALMRQLVAGEIGFFQIEKRYLRKDGTSVWVHLTCSAVRDAEGQLDYLIAVVKNIECRKQAEAELERLSRDLARRLQESEALFEVIPIGICVADDPRCHHIRCNLAMEQMLGIDRGTNPSRTPPPGCPPPPFRLFKDGQERELEGAELPLQISGAENRRIEGWECEVLRADGRRVQMVCNTAPLLDENGAVRGVVGAFVDITERKHIEQALRESQTRLAEEAQAARQAEAKLQRIIDANPLGIILVNPQGIYEANETFLQMVGCTHEDLHAGRIDWRAMTPAEYLPRDEQALAQIIESGVSTPYEKEYVLEDGRRLPVLHGSARLEASPLSWVCFVLDITEHKQAEEQLRHWNEQLEARVVERTAELEILNVRLQREIRERREAEQLFAAAFEAAAVGIGICRADGRFVRTNRTLQTILGYTEVELQSLRCRELTHPEDLKLELPLEQALLAGDIRSYHLQKRYLRKNGSPVWVQVSVALVHTETGEPRGFVSLVEDITGSKQAEEALRLSERKFRGVFDCLSTGLALVSLTGEVLQVNTALAHMLHYREADLLGMHLTALLSPRERGVQGLDRLSELAGETVEMRFVCSDGTLRWGLVSFSLVRADDGSPLYLVVHVADIGERKRAQQELEAAKEAAEAANRAKDQFLAMLSHELRTPLNPIIGWTQMLQRGRVTPEQQQSVLETIERNARLQLQLINELLEVSRIVEGKLSYQPEPLALPPLVRTTVESVGHLVDAATLKLELDIDEQVPQVYGDATKLQQMLWNLLTNAIKFTPAGGRVHLQLTTSDLGVQLVVTDNGIGIPPSFLPRLFERFAQADFGSTRSRGGLGMGLFIVRQIVEAHGGTVKGWSAGEGQGAVFTVDLPAYARPGISVAGVY